MRLLDRSIMYDCHEDTKNKDSQRSFIVFEILCDFEALWPKIKIFG